MIENGEDLGSLKRPSKLEASPTVTRGGRKGMLKGALLDCDEA